MERVHHFFEHTAKTVDCLNWNAFGGVQWACSIVGTVKEGGAVDNEDCFIIYHGIILPQKPAFA
jgi:hypothetical protein